MFHNRRNCWSIRTRARSKATSRQSVGVPGQRCGPRHTCRDRSSYTTHSRGAETVHPRIPWADTVIYELHVSGFTRRHPDVPLELRGTYAGLAHPAAIDYLKSLGVTAVELLPIHHFVSEPAIQRRGMRNYWGYNSIGFFAPHEAYAARRGNQVREFKSMVRTLHAAGLEVILDVVYNHTAEAGPDGPMLSFRGIDNSSYYRLAADDPSRYVDYTGCGNTFDPRRPFPLQLITDSLRYWITEMHVDGFRFDLASALARSLHDVDKLSSFFDTIHQDPIISQAKLIAEPWDVGAGGYQVGEFPPLWTEWNGKYRDTVRSFWATGDGGVRDLAFRLSGSSDLYGDDGRLPIASINFVTSHDGFTMRDLVSYNEKHNDDNGENNTGRHGRQPLVQLRRTRAIRADAVQQVRLRQARNLLTRCCSRPGRRCWSPATNGGVPSAATTTPTCRTTRSPGSTGRPSRGDRTCSTSCRGC